MTKQKLQQQLQIVRRNHILDAAITVIAENGFERTTIKQIAKEAGIADGTIYNYFDNKSAIMTAIVARLTEAEAEDLTIASAEEMDAKSAVRTLIPKRMKEAEEQLDTIKIVTAETLSNPTLRQHVNDTIYTPLFAIAETYFQQLIDTQQLSIDDPKLATRLIASPAFGLLFLRLLGDDHVAENWDTYTDALTNHMLQLMEDFNEQ